MTQTLLTQIKDGIATVSLNRPDRKNAMSFEMMTELVETATTLATTKGLRAVILTGSDNCFCAGIDLESLMSIAPRMDEVRNQILNPPNGAAANEFQAPITIWSTLPVPVIAAIEGVAYGAGAQLALGADFRIAAPDAKLSIMEAKWGLIPDMGISQSLPRLMRADAAMELIMTGRVLEADEALNLGLLTRIADDPLDAAITLAQNLITKSPDALAASKKLVNGTWGRGEAGLKLEAQLQAAIIGQPNQMEKVMSVMQKRDPKFSY
ncbi:MAG: crotonase/enoyl-CoA hydratase family protein [Proteobacteria bacterium]|nr:crotonase/enoyl-CoA hydratase family protein [Pseudomonadota bacterium]